VSEPGRAEALALLHEWNENPSLRKHGLLVEAGVRGYAADDGQDPVTVERWGIAGLLHDLDYERHPDAATTTPWASRASRAWITSSTPATSLPGSWWRWP
jgi:predicted hydrolase (HD superfamily)